MSQRAIPRIAVHRVGPPSRRAAFAGDRRNRLHQFQELIDVWDVGGREDRRQRKSLGIDDEMMFGAGFAAIGGIGAGQFAPPDRAQAGTVDDGS